MKKMKNDFETKFTGWIFIVAAILLWGGWAFTSHHVGEYLVASDFISIGENVWYWIWMCRFHIYSNKGSIFLLLHVQPLHHIQVQPH